MNKVFIIIRREFLSRIRKRSFIIMTFLGPLLFALLFSLPAWISSLEDQEIKKIAVIDSSSLFIGKIPETPYLKFEYLKGVSVETLRENFEESGYYAVLYISHIVYQTPNAIQLMSYKQPSMSVSMHISNALEKEIERQKLKMYKIDKLDDIIKSVNTNVQIRTIRWSRDGFDKSTTAGVAMVVSYFSGILIYMFIFIFGTMVMKGVMEEKTSRIVEIIISSVSSFKLMLGKIIGIAMVGLTQFLAWILLTLIFVSIVKNMGLDASSIHQSATPVNIFEGASLPNTMAVEAERTIEIKEMLATLNQLNYGTMAISFVILFLLGYLIYASMFAAIGSLVDIDTDTQQFMLPVTLPMVAAIFIMIHAIQNPDSSLSFWASLFPLTSPIVMMARIPYGVPFSEFVIAVILLIITFFAMVVLSAKVYKGAILMYGQKISFTNISSWLKSK